MTLALDIHHGPEAQVDKHQDLILHASDDNINHKKWGLSVTVRGNIQRLVALRVVDAVTGAYVVGFSIVRASDGKPYAPIVFHGGPGTATGSEQLDLAVVVKKGLPMVHNRKCRLAAACLLADGTSAWAYSTEVRVVKRPFWTQTPRLPLGRISVASLASNSARKEAARKKAARKKAAKKAAKKAPKTAPSPAEQETASSFATELAVLDAVDADAVAANSMPLAATPPPSTDASQELDVVVAAALRFDDAMSWASLPPAIEPDDASLELFDTGPVVAEFFELLMPGAPLGLPTDANASLPPFDGASVSLFDPAPTPASAPAEAVPEAALDPGVVCRVTELCLQGPPYRMPAGWTGQLKTRGDGKRDYKFCEPPAGKNSFRSHRAALAYIAANEPAALVQPLSSDAPGLASSEAAVPLQSLPLSELPLSELPLSPLLSTEALPLLSSDEAVLSPLPSNEAGLSPLRSSEPPPSAEAQPLPSSEAATLEVEENAAERLLRELKIPASQNKAIKYLVQELEQHHFGRGCAPLKANAESNLFRFQNTDDASFCIELPEFITPVRPPHARGSP